ncbi:MAG: glycosyltransferase family 39 protein [Bacteroidetes bacterium]|nr:glycosyltransferase family 39 protein [Fibrella sp.]
MAPLLRPPFTWQNPLVWQVLAVALLLPALFSHLGYLPLDTDSDEPRRALVALEMILSGDYLTPTLNGIPYFNKPPLYNWIIAGSYRLFGNYSAFALRFPMAVSLLGYALTIYWFVRRYVDAGRFSQAIAFATAFMLLTNVRVWLYDSMLGLIDITFSWVTYTAFMLVYHFDRQKKYGSLYLTTYALTAVGFLMKGLPSVVFQGLTLLAWFAYTRNWRALLHPTHLAGLAVFGGLVGSYYLAYFARNDIPIGTVFGTMFSESAKRTVIQFGIGETVLHLLTFPFEMQYRYAPWLLLGLLFIRKRIHAYLTGNPFVGFNALIFSVNFVVYWSSPQVYARYLLMLLPLLFAALSYVYYVHADPAAWQRRTIDSFFVGVAVVISTGVWVALFLPETRVIPGIVFKVMLTSALLAFMAWNLIRQPTHRLTIFLVFMVALRLGFNWIVLPPRVGHRLKYQISAETVARQTMGKPLFGYKRTMGYEKATDANTFHLEAMRGEILRLTTEKISGAYYIADSVNLVGERYKPVGRILLFDEQPASVVQFVK